LDRLAVRFLDKFTILVISMEFASFHHSDSGNLEVATTFLEKMWAPESLCIIYVTCMIVFLGVVWLEGLCRWSDG
jgi:hypothetical protein